MKRIARQAQLWKTEELALALEGLLKTDRLMKASGASDEALLEEWLLALMTRTRAAA